MQRREKRNEGAWEQSERRKDLVVNRVGRGGEKKNCLVVVGTLLLMGQHELNTTAAIVY